MCVYMYDTHNLTGIHIYLCHVRMNAKTGWFEIVGLLVSSTAKKKQKNYVNCQHSENITEMLQNIHELANK